MAVTLTMVTGALVAYAKYRSVWGSIKRIAVSDLGKRPPQYNNALNILLIGSDSGAQQGIYKSNLADTIMVAHISPGRRDVVVLSFPRDTVVPIYQCQSGNGYPGQTARSGQIEQIADTLAYGGPACLWKTLEQTTHIRIDNFIELNFRGFVNIVNALGGVTVCLPYAIHANAYDQLTLSRGVHHLAGRKALLFWRLRHVGLGSDLQRIQRDQLLMVSLVRQVLHGGMLSSPSRLDSIITTTARWMTTDQGLTPGRMLQIAQSFQGISSRSIQFIEVPYAGYPPNLNWVEFGPQAPALFSAIAHDTKLPKVSRSRARALLKPSEVSVRVLNGSGVAGLAGRTATALAGRGFRVPGKGNAANFSYTTSVVEYGSAAGLAAARTVAAQVPKTTLRLTPGIGKGTVDLILGSSFRSLTPRPARRSISSLSKQYGGLTGNANVCKDQSAWAG